MLRASATGSPLSIVENWSGSDHLEDLLSRAGLLSFLPSPDAGLEDKLKPLSGSIERQPDVKCVSQSIARRV